jgi:hypothetical protein
VKNSKLLSDQTTQFYNILSKHGSLEKKISTLISMAAEDQLSESQETSK